jgi:xanthine dehydrogenase accessory factor
MRDEITALLDWQCTGQSFAIATVIGTAGSAPRPSGALLALHPDGRIVGNVSGGCVEPAVVQLAEKVLATGRAECVRFGYSNDEALSVGLTCGGEVEVLVRRVDLETLPLLPLQEALEADQSVVLATVVGAPRPLGISGHSIVVTEDAVHGSLADMPLGRVLTLEARSALSTGGVSLRRLGADGERLGDEITVLLESFVNRPRLIVFGAVDYAAAVATVGRFLGFRVTVCDARAAFTTPDRFPDAHEVVVEWPHRFLAGTELDDRSAVCVLTHDPKFDVPAIVEALRTPAAYIGVMGSRRTHAERLERLKAVGVTDAELERLRSPIGLALGGRSPQETAISIGAELIMVRTRSSGLPLRDIDGPIHPRLTGPDARARG